MQAPQVSGGGSTVVPALLAANGGPMGTVPFLDGASTSIQNTATGGSEIGDHHADADDDWGDTTSREQRTDDNFKVTAHQRCPELESGKGCFKAPKNSWMVTTIPLHGLPAFAVRKAEQFVAP